MKLKLGWFPYITFALLAISCAVLCFLSPPAGQRATIKAAITSQSTHELPIGKDLLMPFLFFLAVLNILLLIRLFILGLDLIHRERTLQSLRPPDNPSPTRAPLPPAASRFLRHR